MKIYLDVYKNSNKLNLRSQSQIARLESGTHFPSLQTLHKYAQAIHRPISLKILP